MRQAALLVIVLGFAAVGILDCVGGDMKSGIASLCLAVANYLFLV